MALYHVEAIILRSRDLGEADRLVTAYSLEEGKLAAVAKGARRPGSRLAAAVQPFACARLLLWRGKHLDVVTQGQLLQSLPRLRSHLLGLAAASLLAELVDSFTQERDPAPSLFALLRGSLAALDETVGEAGRSLEGVAYAFVLGLLALAGYAPRLTRCVHCGEAPGSGEQFFDATGGGLVCSRCQRGNRTLRLSEASRRVLLHLAGCSPRAASRLAVSTATMDEVRSVVVSCLEARLEARPRAWDFWYAQVGRR
ncbi:MAG: DNA repair protein RecO [Bacillota bacterium]|nr:DNA repair protein RecO [Bacillota bacterium]